MLKTYIHKISLVLLIILMTMSCASAATTVPDICENVDAQTLIQSVVTKMLENKTTSGSTTGAAAFQEVDAGSSSVYGDNTWIVSCSVAYGLPNLDGAISILKEKQDEIAMSAAEGNKATSQDLAAVSDMISSLEEISNSKIFEESIFTRTYWIGLYLIFLTFLISLAVKLYGLFIGKSSVEPIDLIFYIFRLIVLIALMSFLRPLVFFGMGLSTDIANMLLNTPITSTISSGVLYTDGNYSSTEGTTSSNPWLNTSARISSGYGAQDYNRKNSGGHRGIDYAVGQGTPIYAPYDGQATALRDSSVGGFGNYITLKMTQGGYTITHRAGHLDSFSDIMIDSSGKLKANVTVTKGQQLGTTGNSGNPVGGGSYGYHLHADTKVSGGGYQGTHVNPAMVYDFIDGAISDLSGTSASSSSTSSSSTGTTTVGSEVESTGQGSYTITGQDALTMSTIYAKMLVLKYDLSAAEGKDQSLWKKLTSGLKYFGTYIISSIATALANAILTVLIVLADVMMAITLALGPLVIALSFIPQFENFLQQWIKGYVTFLFYQPLASIFQILNIVMMAVTLDSGFTPYLILCFCFIGACLKIPNIADGLSTSAVMSVASMMAIAPGKFTLQQTAAGAGQGISSAARGINALIGKYRGGRIKIKFAALIAVVGILIAATCGFAADMTTEEKKAILEIGTTTSYPSQEKLDAVLARIKGTTSNTTSDGIIGVSGADQNDPAAGIYNTSYTNAIDTPMVKYVLGYGKINAAGIYTLTKEIAIQSAVSSASLLANMGSNNKYYEPDTSSIEASNEMKYIALSNESAVVQTMLDEAQNSIVNLLMRDVPLYILILMFLLQLCCIGYLKFTNEEGIGARLNYLSTVPRLVLYIALIVLFPHLVGSAITISNYISNAILPIESQELLMANISGRVNAVNGGAEIKGWAMMICRALTYMAIKILLIARDMFLSITIIVGPTCIALGYFTRYRDPDYIHQFFTGWLENFIKILFWGPLAAIMLFCLGAVSVLTSMDMMSAIATVVTAFAFVFAASNLPNMAEKVSSVAVMGVLSAVVAPMIQKGTSASSMASVNGIFLLGKKSGLGNNIMNGLTSVGKGMGAITGIHQTGGLFSKLKSKLGNTAGILGKNLHKDVVAGAGGSKGVPGHGRTGAGAFDPDAGFDFGSGGGRTTPVQTSTAGSNFFQKHKDPATAADINKKLFGGPEGSGAAMAKATGDQTPNTEDLNKTIFDKATDGASGATEGKATGTKTPNAADLNKAIFGAAAAGTVAGAMAGKRNIDQSNSQSGTAELNQTIFAGAEGKEKDNSTPNVKHDQAGMSNINGANPNGTPIVIPTMAKGTAVSSGNRLMKSAITGESIPLIANRSSINEASRSVLHTLNVTGDMNDMAKALSEGNLTNALFADNTGLVEQSDFNSKIGVHEGSDFVQTAAIGSAVVKASNSWNNALSGKHETSGYKDISSVITEAQSNIEQAISAVESGKMTEAEASDIISASTYSVTQALDRNVTTVKENGGTVAAPQVPSFGSAFQSSGLGGKHTLGFSSVVNNAYEQIDIKSFSDTISSGSLYEAVMGDSGLINNTEYMQETGLANETTTVRTLTTGSAGVNYAQNYVNSMYAAHKITKTEYNTAINTLQKLENETKTMMNDYSGGTMTATEEEVTHTMENIVQQASNVVTKFQSKEPTFMQEFTQNWQRSMGSINKYTSDLKHLVQDQGIGQAPHIKDL